MTKISRRNFLKTTALTAVSLSSLNASYLEVPQTFKQVKYFIKDSEVSYQEAFVNVDNILVVERDISDIYAKLKEIFADKALVGSVSSGATFFVIQRMAADYGMHVAYKEKQGDIYTWILAPKGVRL